VHLMDDITIGRAERALAERILPAVHGPIVALQVSRHELPGEPVAPALAIAADYGPFETGAEWGRAWGTTWFRLEGRIPPEWAGRPVEALIDLGFGRSMPGFQCEGLAFTAAGRAIKSLNPQNQWVRVSDLADEDGRVEFFVEAASNPVLLQDLRFEKTLQGDIRTASDRALYRLRRADLAVLRTDVFELAMDLDVLLGLQRQLPEGPRRARILQALDDAIDVLDLQDVAGSAAAAREPLRAVLAAPAEHSAHRISAIGHAHIDSAWLWPIRETVRKLARTVASMLDLLDSSDDFLYGMSSAQQYAWIRDSHPDLWQRLKAAVESGRFIPLGGMWVESDTVMPSGESLVRQFLYGQRFFEKEFGLRPKGVWLPDTFGYSPALPQLIRRAGFEWFFTQKLSWNQTNLFPHHTFAWHGIDGSGILTHFPPMDTYAAELTAEELARASRTFRENRVVPGSIAPTGFGDGGGGTTREMLARAARTADLEGSPRVAWESPDDYFASLAGIRHRLPTWDGELYLEFHRGTLTSQHAMKQGNRRVEQLLVEAELWSATVSVRLGIPYPFDEIDALWQTVLLHQFHDILPGTSIAWVHREARETYGRLEREARALIERAQRELAGVGEEMLTFNGSAFEVQGVPAGGAAVLDGEGVGVVEIRETDRGWTLRNDLVEVQVTADGLIPSAVDLATGREAIFPGRAANVLHIHQDFPNKWDAWDVDPFYRNTRHDVADATSSSITVRGERAEIAVERAISEVSSVLQRISLEWGSRELVIEQTTEWRETEKLLKLSFPLNVRAEHTSAETQFGFVTRPTHTNTSWDDARFETSMHRYVHVAEGGFGIALTNDSSYGFDALRIRGENDWGIDIRPSLLRAPQYPDPETDQGTHSHRFGLVIGADLDAATRYGARAYAQRNVVRGAGSVDPLVVVRGSGIAVSSVKLAADRSGDLIVRAHEYLGCRTAGQLRISAPVSTIQQVSLLEDALEEPIAWGGSAAFDLGAFEVRTWRVRLDRPVGE